MRSVPKNFRSAALSTATQPWLSAAPPIRRHNEQGSYGSMDPKHLIAPNTPIEAINSLSAMDGRDRPLKKQLCSTVVSRQIFIRSRSLIAR